VYAVDFLEKIWEHAIVLSMKLSGRPDTEYRPGSPFLRAIDRSLARFPLLRRLSWDYDLSGRA
jgi:hypothetical protein